MAALPSASRTAGRSSGTRAAARPRPPSARSASTAAAERERAREGARARARDCRSDDGNPPRRRRGGTPTRGGGRGYGRARARAGAASRLEVWRAAAGLGRVGHLGRGKPAPGPRTAWRSGAADGRAREEGGTSRRSSWPRGRPLGHVAAFMPAPRRRAMSARATRRRDPPPADEHVARLHALLRVARLQDWVHALSRDRRGGGGRAWNVEGPLRCDACQTPVCLRALEERGGNTLEGEAKKPSHTPARRAHDSLPHPGQPAPNQRSRQSDRDVRARRRRRRRGGEARPQPRALDAGRARGRAPALAEDTPAYKVLRHHGLLVNKYRIDTDVGSAPALDCRAQMLDALEEPALRRVLLPAQVPVPHAEVPAGHVRLADDGRGGFEFYGQGVHLICDPFYTVRDAPVRAPNVIQTATAPRPSSSRATSGTRSTRASPCCCRPASTSGARRRSRSCRRRRRRRRPRDSARELRLRAPGTPPRARAAAASLAPRPRDRARALSLARSARSRTTSTTTSCAWARSTLVTVDDGYSARHRGQRAPAHPRRRALVRAGHAPATRSSRSSSRRRSSRRTSSASARERDNVPWRSTRP